LEADMAKITERSHAQEFTSLRNRKIRSALSALRAAEIRERGKLNYALYFWAGSEGVSWYLTKNELDPAELQGEFDDAGIDAFKDRADIERVAQAIQELERRFLDDITALVEATL
jgi:hypothetical protein